MSKSQLEVVCLFAFAAGVAAALSSAAPTGTTWWDPILNAALAVAFVGAASTANRVVLVAVAGLAAALVGLNPWLIFGLGGFACAFAAEVRSDRRIELQAAAGALTITALLHLNSFGFFGLPSLIAGIAVLAVFVSWYRASTPKAQQRSRRIVGAGLMASLVVSVAAAAMLWSVRSTANEGVEAARQGLVLARAGDPQELSRQLEIASDRLASANDTISSPILKPLLLVPVGAQHLRAVSVASEQGALVASEANAMVTEADLGRLELRQGQFDLDQLTAMTPRLEQIVAELDTSIRRLATVRSGWLVPQVDDQVQLFTDEVSQVLPEAQLAVDAARVMPRILGADQQRRYLMLFGSPGESREFGGFVGGYALLGVVDGNLDLIDAGSINELRVVGALNQGPLLTELPDPDTYPTQYVAANPAKFPQNLTSTPNLADMLRAARQVFPELAGAPIDGLIYADPFALGALTDFTGPITVAGVEEPLDRAGVSRFILNDQYELFYTRDQRFDAMGSLAIATAAAFENANLPGPEQLGRVLGPIARAGRLQVVTTDPAENAFLTSVLLQRNFAAPTSIDSFAVIHTNGTESKLDLYLDRDIHYDVTIGDDGTLSATVDVEVRSAIPGDAPPLTFGSTDGTNKVLLSLYSPHELTSLTVDGAPHEYVQQQEYGFFRYALFNIPLAPNTSASLRFELVGQAPDDPYRVGVWSQPLVNPDTVRVTHRGATGNVVSAEKQLVETWLFDPATSRD